MIQVVVNVFGFLGVAFGAASLIYHFRVMYHTKDPRHSWYGGATLMFRPDLLTPRGRRLLGISRLCWVTAVVCCFVVFCLTPMLPKG
jgi:hypothetical protein